jgi:hypothetical protein
MGFRARLLQEVPQEIFESAVLADVVNVPAEYGWDERLGLRFENDRYDSTVPLLIRI